jgi:Predicted acyltransferase
LTTFIIPDNAVVDYKFIKTNAGMIIGNHSQIERDLQIGFLMAGESVHVSGQIVSENDLRADVWCRFDKDVYSGGDAYLGEFTTINGKITVEGDLDVGKEVKLNGGFLSKGWIVVRNPLPFMVFIFLYIRELMRLGKTSEEIDKTLSEFFEDDEEIDLEKLDESNLSEILNRGGFFVIPLGTKVSLETINVPDDAVVGNECIVNSQLICKKFEGGKNLVFNGLLRSKGEVLIADGSKIKGEINTSGKLIIGKDVKIEGIVSAKSIILHETSFVEGVVSCGNIRFAVGDDFDIKDLDNKEKAVLLSKSESFEKMKTNILFKDETEFDEKIIDSLEDDDEEAANDAEEEAEAADDTAAKAADDTTVEAADDTAAEAADDTAAEAADDTTVKATGDTAAEAADDTAAEAADDTTVKAADDTAAKAADDTAAEAADDTTVKAADDTAVKAADDTATETVSKKTINSAAEADSSKSDIRKNSRRLKSHKLQKNSRKAKQSQIDDLTIVNVFTGENVENEHLKKQE